MSPVLSPLIPFSCKSLDISKDQSSEKHDMNNPVSFPFPRNIFKINKKKCLTMKDKNYYYNSLNLRTTHTETDKVRINYLVVKILKFP